MQTPMFKDFNSEEEACKAVEKMKRKYNEARIKVITPFPKNNQSKTSEDYGLPEKNVYYELNKGALTHTLQNFGFSEEQATTLKDNIDLGQVLVVICQ